MKSSLILGLIILGIASCKNLDLTENYLKNNIQHHKVGAYSTVKYRLYSRNIGAKSNVKVEILGYKYEDTKGLLIGAVNKINLKTQYQNIVVLSNKKVIELTVKECELIIAKKDEINKKFNAIKTKKNENKTIDYTVNNQFVIGYSLNSINSNIIIDLWIKGEKYTVDETYFYSILNQFILY